jgi:hypothetical protein
MPDLEAPAPAPDGAGLAFWLGTLHAALLMLVLVLLLHVRGDLGDTLASLNTLVGLALFALLWGVAVYATSRAIEGLDLLAPAFDEVVRRGLKWGAMAGLLLFAPLAGLIVVGLTADALTGRQDAAVFLVVPLYVVPGAILAALAGGATGFLAALVDTLILPLALWLSPLPARPRGRPSPNV